MRFTSWKFTQKPTDEQLYEMLKEIPAWNAPDAKPMSEYSEYVIPLKQWNKEQKMEEWRAYVLCTGKMKILADAHMVDGKRVPTIETMETRFVGNMCVTSGTIESPIYGKVSDVATGLIENGKGADSTHPLENSATSLRARLITALCGAGILPFSGVASVEEMMSQESRNELAEAGMRVIKTDVNPKETKPQEPAASPQEAREEAVAATGKTQGGMTIENATRIVEKIKESAPSEEVFIAAMKEFLQSQELSAPDDQIFNALVQLPASQLGKAHTTMINYAKTHKG